MIVTTTSDLLPRRRISAWNVSQWISWWNDQNMGLSTRCVNWKPSLAFELCVDSSAVVHWVVSKWVYSRTDIPRNLIVLCPDPLANNPMGNWTRVNTQFSWQRDSSLNIVYSSPIFWSFRLPIHFLTPNYHGYLHPSHMKRYH